MQRTPGMTTTINTQTQRTGLASQNHHIVLMTGDTSAPTVPRPIYDSASADVLCGPDSKAGRMMAAALSVSQGVRVDVMGK
jgi:phage tail sheath gpL-like